MSNLKKEQDPLGLKLRSEVYNKHPKYVVATIHSWNTKNYKKFFNEKTNFYLINDKKDFSYEKLQKINPKYIFIPHWSWIIPKKIWSNFNCIVFHMTDLPYGRGGTPLQNLISRGHKKTKISAIKVDQGLDTGDIYMKEELNLNGRAEDIYKRASDIIFKKMIPYIIKNDPLPKKQKGKVVKFERRKPEQSKILNGMDLDKTYDLIRMLDAEEYPKAFLETNKLKFELSRVKLKDNKLLANIEIYEK